MTLPESVLRRYGRRPPNEDGVPGRRPQAPAPEESDLPSSDRRWVSAALRQAATSQHEFQQVGAVVVRGGRLLGAASNHNRYGHCAEVRALGRVGDPAGATVYVARLSRRLSRPCGRCWRYLRAFGVRDAVYASQDGSWIRERVT